MKKILVTFGKGLMQSWATKAYAKKYAIWMVAFAVLAVVSAYWAASSWKIALAGMGIVASLAVLMEAKAVQRAIKEGYASHLAYVPAVMALRGLWYAKGMITYVFWK